MFRIWNSKLVLGWSKLYHWAPLKPAKYIFLCILLASLPGSSALNSCTCAPAITPGASDLHTDHLTSVSNKTKKQFLVERSAAFKTKGTAVDDWRDDRHLRSTFPMLCLVNLQDLTVMHWRHLREEYSTQTTRPAQSLLTFPRNKIKAEVFLIWSSVYHRGTGAQCDLRD